MDFFAYDFLDFGASTGGSIAFARKHLGGQRGLGIDRHPQKIRQLRDAGYEGLLADITNIDAPAQCVRFVTMIHLLEHLPDLETITATLRMGAFLARDFLFIRGPNFDDDAYLREQGVKWYWSDWPRAHTYHLTTAALHQCCDALHLSDRYLCHFRGVNTTQDPALHPLHSPPGQHDYDATVHPSKTVKPLDRIVFKEFAVFVRLRPFKEWTTVIHALDRYV